MGGGGGGGYFWRVEGLLFGGVLHIKMVCFIYRLGRICCSSILSSDEF